MRRASLVVVLVVGLMFAPTLASAKNIRVIDPSGRPHGQSYGEWGAAWWQWALAQPIPTNPVVDDTGEDCTNGQSGRVWFLAGTTGGSVERDCLVPRGTMLFFPIINALVFDSPGVVSEDDLRADAAELMDDATGLEVTIDGVSIAGPELAAFRVQSPLFEFTVPANNLIGATPGTYDGVTDGYYLMVPPLRPGEHTIEFEGALPSFEFFLDVVYNLTVGG